MEIKTTTVIIELKTLEKAAAERLKYLYISYADCCARIVSGGKYTKLRKEEAKETFQEIMRLRSFLGL